MKNGTNLAFKLDTSYNDKENIAFSNTFQIQNFNNKNFLIQTKRALILRENILASGMEVTDIKKAHDISKHLARR